MKLTPTDCLAVGFCTRGQMRFCRQHGIDFRRFHDDGIDTAELQHIEDSNLARALAQAEAREQGKV